MNAPHSPPTRKTVTPVLVILLITAALPLLISSGFQLRLVMLICIYAILSMSFNLLYGYTGQISMGQQTFYAIGAYAFTMLMTKVQWSAPVAALVSVALTAGLALLIGAPLLRLRTHYLAMATLAFALIIYGISTRWIDVTGGSSGLAVPPVMVGDAPLSRMGTYYLLLVCVGVVLLLHDYIVRGHIGRAMQAIRDDDTAASALGVDVVRYKLRIFVLAAVLAAVAGICFAILSLRVDPSMSEFRVLVSVLTIAVVGGLGTRFGPILGSVVVVLLPQILVRFGELETLIYGAFILVFLLFMPHGLAGYLEGGDWKRLLSKRSRSAVSAADPSKA
jgi:branched-chain amino acid transport system permease protein